ncbi:MAG TPA: rRNA maturation RNase YbeY [bacterium]|nr:rRNA maturation RNase YbeY [bacterium]HPN81255.1 rRNA maturation RNase YbeY [bacterium]HPW39252.1 rRNA maturation RNase YbeY [bacterium]
MIILEVNRLAPLPVANSWLKTVVDVFNRVVVIPGRPQVSLVFVDKNSIKKLNRLYRRQNRPTDVLSFTDDGDDFIQPTEERITLGEIVICSEIAKDQARQFKQPLKWEVARLVIHGLAHLAGFDHENCSKEAAQEMLAVERRALELLK